VGLPYDSTTSYRPGARFGPDALRVSSVSIESYSPHQDADLHDFDYCDLGNVALPFGAPGPAIERIERCARWLLESDVRPLFLGGEHSVTSGVIRVMAPENPGLVVIQLDAHADLRHDYLGEAHNHACAMRRVLDHVGPERLIQVGIRAGTREEFVEMRETGRLCGPSGAALREKLAKHPTAPLYLTVDLDAFDPSELPGTGNPEAGGLRWADFEAILDEIDGGRLVGADVVELSPPWDQTGASAGLAAKCVREVAIRMGARLPAKS
jgi:agmatinase